MSHLANAFEPGTEQPRSTMFWGILAALAVGQLFAFWLLCSHQVRKAEARQNEAVVQQMALSDCLQYIPGSTIASCTTRSGVNTQAPVSNASVTGAVPVSFSYR